MKEHRNQGRLNFTHANKLFILREVAPFLPHPRMTRVLRAIQERHWQYARDADEVTLSHKQIATCDGMSVPTVRRAIADLIDHNLLIKTETVSCYGRQANSYKIVWSNLDAIVNDGEPLVEPAPVPEKSEPIDSETSAPDLEYESTQVVKTACDHHDHPPDHGDYPPDHSDHPPPDHHDQASIFPRININPPPPSGKEPTWEEVEIILFSEMKVGRAVSAIEAAQGRGCSPYDIMRLIEHARSKPGAYGPGAIFTRVSQAVPSADPSFGWPNENKGYRQQKAIKEAESKRDQEVAEREQKRLQDQRARDQLERTFGPQLDAMDLSELRSFAVLCPTVVAGAIRRDPAAARQSGGLYRIEILKALYARQSECLDNLNSATAEETVVAERR